MKSISSSLPVIRLCLSAHQLGMSEQDVADVVAFLKKILNYKYETESFYLPFSSTLLCILANGP
jgi:hypothetical protein